MFLLARGFDNAMIHNTEFGILTSSFTIKKRWTFHKIYKYVSATHQNMKRLDAFSCLFCLVLFMLVCLRLIQFYTWWFFHETPITNSWCVGLETGRCVIQLQTSVAKSWKHIWPHKTKQYETKTKQGIWLHRSDKNRWVSTNFQWPFLLLTITSSIQTHHQIAQAGLTAVRVTLLANLTIGHRAVFWRYSQVLLYITQPFFVPNYS